MAENDAKAVSVDLPSEIIQLHKFTYYCYGEYAMNFLVLQSTGECSKALGRVQ